MVHPPKDLYDLSSPVLVLWKICGLPHYEIRKSQQLKNKTLVVKNSKIFCVFLVFIVSNILGYNAIYKGISNTFTDYTKLYQLLACMMDNIGTIVICQTQKYNFCESIRRCNSIASEKLALDHTIVIKLHRTLLIIYVAQILPMALTSGYIYWHGIDTEMIAYQMEWYCSAFCELFLFYFLVVLNELYAQLEKSFNRNKTNNLENLMVIYWQLFQVSKNINKAFSKLIILKSFSDFAFITVQLANVLSYDPKIGGISLYWWDIIILHTWIPVTLITYLRIALYFEKIVEKVSLFFLVVQSNLKLFSRIIKSLNK